MITIRIIDIESCGLPPDDCQIVEVATVDLVQAESPDDGWVRGRVWSSLVNPGREIPPEASAVHHITDRMVERAPPFEAVLDQVLNDGEKVDHIAAHEAKFEKACLPELIAKRIDLCTRKCAMTIWPDAPNYKAQTLRYYLGLKFAEELGPPHRAVSDAYVAAAILRTVLRRVTLPAALHISSRPVLLTSFRFGKHAKEPIGTVPEDYLRWLIKSDVDDEDAIYTARCELAERKEAKHEVPGYGARS